MLLIILLGVITKLAVVSADCDIDTINRNYTDWNNFTGTWYWLYHTPQKHNENLECPVSTFQAVTENLGRITTYMYIKSTQTRDLLTGTAVDWNTNGYFDFYYPEPNRDIKCLTSEICTNISSYARIWTGRYHALSVDHGRYAILKYCGFKPDTLTIYVVFRSPNPDEETLDNVKKDLKQNGLDFNQLVKWENKQCQDIPFP